MTDVLLAINAGSSSIKFTAYDTDYKLKFHGQIDDSDAAPHFTVRSHDGAELADRTWPAGSQTHEILLGALLDWTERHLQQDRLIAVGHRHRRSTP